MVNTRRFLLLASIVLSALSTTTATVAQQEPLRIFIRSGPKSHGPGAHDYPRFLKEWVPLLNERGARATGADTFPTKAQLDETDVLILHKQEAGNVDEPDRKNLQEYLARGGGLIVIHAGTVSRDPDWFRVIVGGSWRNGTTRWLEGPMHLYFTDHTHPITKDASNWEMDDEIYYDMDILPEAHILASAYTPKPAGARNAGAQRRADELTGGGKKVSIYDIQPQMWTYERTVEGGRAPYRAFVSIPGHLYENFNRPNYRAILLRGIAWAGKRANVDELVKKEELGDALRYPAGGPTAPAKAAAKIEVHPEFDLSLVASEPLIAKAMNIDWDEKERLWVSETPEYPNGRRVPNTALWKDSGSLRPRQDRDPEDTISILSDTNGDGVMDRKHVFADKLELVTGFVFYKNGVIAATAPDIWFLEDTNGDEVADKRTKLYTGLGIVDTHAVINNLRWGLDGWIYATHGYSVGMVTSPDGTKSFGRDGSGVVRFKPDGSAFEQYSSRNGNTWGLDITWDGQVFWTQPTSGTVFFHTVLPEAILAKGKLPGTTAYKGMITGQTTYPVMSRAEQAYVQIDQVGQFTAAAGAAVYDGGAWPDKWRYSYFTGEPTLNIVHQQFVKPQGVSYVTEKEQGREQTEFMRSGDMWFRPIETRVGPDGALYVIDFYNQAAIHNDTRGPQHGPANAAVRPDRDHFFGRIWRVQHKQAKKLDVPAMDRRDLSTLISAMETSPNAHVKETAWRLAQENFARDPRLARVNRRMGSKALELYEQARAATTAAARKAQLDTFTQASDPWTKSAIVAAATEQAPRYVADAFAYSRPEALTDFVAAVVPSALPAGAGDLLVTAAAGGPQTIALKTIVVRGVAQMDGTLTLNATTTPALRALLDNPATTAAALPIVARWDKAGVLRASADAHGKTMLRELRLAATSDDRRAEIASSLLAVPPRRAEALAAISAMIDAANVSEALKTTLIATLGDSTEADASAALVAAFARSGSAPLFEQILRRPSSSLALLAAIKSGKVTAAKLGATNAARLRTHPDRQVARQATALLDALTPQARMRSELIATLTPQVEKPGDAEKGKELFTGLCATCHKLGTLGKNEIGPPLNGMGAHARAELLGHIIDPNREVDPSFYQWNVTTKKGETFVGIVASENAASVTLRNQSGDVEIKKEDISTRENTRRSFMPEGLESLGGDGLRDILTFIASTSGDVVQKYRVINLRDAYTADSRRGVRREEERDDTVTLHRFGDVTVQGVPFFVMDPARSTSANNLIALKGGPGTGNVSDAFPQRVEIPAPVTAASLHFLGGMAGWAWPVGGDQSRGAPAMKVIVQFADGTSEEHVLENGEQFAEFGSNAAVPGATPAGDFTRRGQLRYFALNLKKAGALSKIVLESFDSDIVPCTVAITAGTEPAATPSSTQAPAAMAPAPQSSGGAAATPAAQDGPRGPKEGGRGDAPLPETKPIVWAPGKTKVLIIAGGSSHNFGKFFGETDGATLSAAGFSVNYTEDRDQAAAELRNADVAVVSVNRQFFDTPAYRKALFDFAAAGKGLVMLHPGTWYGFPEWPELNATIVGGGARGHDRIAAFSVKVLQPQHPIMKGVPESFDVEDELYYLNAEAEKIPAGTAVIDVLAETSPSVRFKKPHPAVWITKHPSARIVGITLGHDERVHDHAAFKTLLVNAVRWAGTAGVRPQGK
ncbi:MAG TPA: PVC-type heme-binding CxxCH protein [Vicinamibacterales bacterium]|nr:PVC-type heme-binding CxxCH protein [Vicinamibacterales bacterium]